MTDTQNKQPLKVIPLGGLHEIGKNTCVFEYEDEIMLLDAGLAFPSDGMHGINVVLPDLTYLRENRHKIKGMIVTHGHEDHIGGIPYHLKQIDIPIIYGPRLAMALLRGKLEESGGLDRTKIETVMPREMVKIGKHFVVEFIRNTHSIADSFSIAIHTPVGVVIHTGDFKFDHTPVDGEKYDFFRLAEHGEKGVLCLIADSTNSELPGFTPSEMSVYPNLRRAIVDAPGRVFVTTFASSVHRVNMILDIANKCGRKVGVIGRSMLNTIAQARLLGYIKCPDDVFVPLQVINQLPDDKILILSTGSQGEPLAAMTRIANDAYRQVQVKKGDTIIFSANPIPGNTLSVTATIDKLMIKGANVVYGRDKGIHVSGHGCQEDQKLMLSLTRPKYFIPVHGEHRMLVKHSQTAQSMGIPAENMVIIDNGDIVELTPNSLQKAGKVPSGIQLVDRAGIVHDTVMKERQQIAEDGVITAAVAINTSGKLLARPQLNFSGVVMSVEPNLVNNLAVKRIESTIADRWSNFARNLEPGKLDIDWAGLRIELEMTLKRLLHQELKTEPLVMVLLQTPPGVAPLPVSATNTTPTKVIPSPKSLDNPGDRAGNNNPSNNAVIKRTPVPVKEKEATNATTPATGRRRTRSTAQS
jgi:ribonuclease J